MGRHRRAQRGLGDKKKGTEGQRPQQVFELPLQIIEGHKAQYKAPATNGD